MNTKTIALAITLTALTVVLSPAFVGPAIPAPFLPIVSYHIYEIPIVVAFFLIGPKYGFMVAVLNAAVMQTIFPNSPFIRPLPNLVAISSMLLGVYLAYKLVARRLTVESAPQEKKLTVFATAFGITSRVAVMETINYVTMQFAVNSAGVRMPAPINVFVSCIVSSVRHNANIIHDTYRLPHSKNYQQKPERRQQNHRKTELPTSNPKTRKKLTKPFSLHISPDEQKMTNHK